MAARDLAPIETTMFAAGVVNGFLITIGRQPQPAAVVAQFPHWVVVTWGVVQLLGAAMCLVGSLWPRQRGALPVPTVKAAPLAVQMIGLTIYGLNALAACVAAIVVNHGTNSLAVINFFLWAGCLWLYLRIGEQLKENREVVEGRAA